MNLKLHTIRKPVAVGLLLAVCGVLPASALAQVPQLIRYQGTLTDSNGVLLDGTFNLAFRFYDAEIQGTKMWEETQTGVVVTSGAFSVLLGKVTPLSLSFDIDCWLGVSVNGGPELSPRHRVASVPNAYLAGSAGGLVYPKPGEDPFLRYNAGLSQWEFSNDGSASTTSPLGVMDLSARIYNSASISIPHAIVTPLTFDSERWDTGSIHDTQTNTSRLTAKTAGKYFIYGHVGWAGNSTGQRTLLIRLNGGTLIASLTVPASTPIQHEFSIMTHYNLWAGDYVELLVYQDSGVPLSVLTLGNRSPEFGMVKYP